MICEVGTKITCRETGEEFEVIKSTDAITNYNGETGNGVIKTDCLVYEFIVKSV